MRPIGHTKTRGARDASSHERNAPLFALWEQYLASRSPVRFQSVLPLLHDLRPSLSDIDHLILSVYDASLEYDWKKSSDLGTFVSAAYQWVPETIIRYSFHTPYLQNLGSNIYGKELIIDGVVGECAGYGSIGHMTINGDVGKDVGTLMRGVLDAPGKKKIRAGCDSQYFVGRCYGEWNLPECLREQFSQDIRFCPSNYDERIMHAQSMHTRYAEYRLNLVLP
jgi:hypothetical protein